MSHIDSVRPDAVGRVGCLRMIGELPPEQMDLTHKGGDVEIVIGGDADETAD